MLELIKQLVDLVLHIDRYLADVIHACGPWTYLVLFAIIFAETGFVVTPFLPGDSLLFAAGAFAALPATGLNVHLVALLLMIAAIAGDTVNYWLGSRVGPAVFRRKDTVFLRREHLDRAHAFFEKYGAHAIILARFAPIIRTFVPFVAGAGRMTYSRFLAYNVAGGIAWVGAFVYAGYAFGNHPLIKRNFHWVILAIIVLSLLPMMIGGFRAWRERRPTGSSAVRRH